jgi:hypothetical protein
MTRHLQSCLKKSGSQAGDGEKLFHIVVEGMGLSGDLYWLHLKVKAAAKFETLDRFLRDTWLECCGHMSAFRMGRDEVGMNRSLARLLKPKMKLIHEYDFGSTTELLVTVAGEFEGSIRKGKLEILARNDPPSIPCAQCGKPATQICCYCVYSEKGWLCEECAGEHGCGEDMLLPVVNSPRTGVCGYDGE